jgi:hypothetical protein
VLLGLGALGGEPAQSVNSHGSEGLSHSLAPLAAAAGVGALATVVALLALALLRRPGPRELVWASLTALAACAAFGKVLSPQFMLWVAPLLALALAWGAGRLALLLAGSMGLTLAEFPSRYFDLVARDPLAVGIVATRNLLLVGAVVVAVALLWRGTDAAIRVP